ncbi:hypothetical protein COCCADRAFT_42063 [Bipolaris zeicola 26-R-13]|uniref:BTB domain-containing protein n=1 Tax=Cochliobolus carbonum (strain 26-R-13) TaxID=930089 RepID=W6XWE4_COCC2|nr:uncharacterized protein COCCADRAFT_42063 [Bipolaris zeicola 26-R-13]EUC27104.1 hypothetical protein COCCADRAFT_42063 [Bipolaris zeicola 26-R-13]
MLNDTRYSDATVVIYGKNLPIYKFVVCAQSKYLEKVFQDSFVEGSSGVLTFNNGSEPSYWRLFEHLYTGDYPEDLSQDIKDDPALLKESQCIREIYATTPENDLGMRSAVVEIAKVHVKALGSKDIFKNLIREGGDFAVQYFESVIFPPPPATFSTTHPKDSWFGVTSRGSISLGGV